MRTFAHGTTIDETHISPGWKDVELSPLGGPAIDFAEIRRDIDHLYAATARQGCNRGFVLGSFSSSSAEDGDFRYWCYIHRMSGRVYANAPIREAVFDVRFKQEVNDVYLQALELVYKEIASEYPTREELHSQSFSVAHEKGYEPVFNPGKDVRIGLRLASGDKKQILNLSNGNFSFSRMAPYPKWDIFSSEAKRLLATYEKKLKPTQCTRIALRYINSISIPEKQFDISEYFKTEPKVGEDVPQSLVNFFLRATVKDEESDTFAHINETYDQKGMPDSLALLLDIDVFQPNVDVVPNSQDFWNRVEKIKEMRTRIFEGSITDKTRALFD